MADAMESERYPLIFLTSHDKDGDGSDGCITDAKDIIATQSLTIVEEDGSLGSVEDQTAVAELAQTQGLLEAAGDDDVQYQFRSVSDGTVTYRVVPVQVGGGDSPEPQLPAMVADGPATFATTSASTAGIQAVLTNPINGQVYVIGSPQEVFAAQTGRSLAPRGGSSESGLGRGNGSTRDDRRRATHNEVERRRRDKINNWIGKLSKIIPNCSPESAKSGQSKGGILAKACEYITELRESNHRMAETARVREKELEQLRHTNEELERENAALRAQLARLGAADAASS